MEKPPRILRVSKELTPPTVAIASIACVCRMWLEPSPAQAGKTAAYDVRFSELQTSSNQNAKDIDKLTALYVDLDHRQREDKDEYLRELFKISTSVARIEEKLDRK